jgi:subtilisin family serine protease
MFRRALTFAATLFVAASISFSQPTTYQGKKVASGRVIVKFKANAESAALARIGGRVRISRVVPVGGGGAMLIHAPLASIEDLMTAFRGDSGVEYVEPDGVTQVGQSPQTTPNDPRFGELWGLRNAGQVVGGRPGKPGADIAVQTVWPRTKGSNRIVVAVLDSGVASGHSDLSANVWHSPTSFTLTLAGRTIVCPAGTAGFNAIALTCGAVDDHGHGTHVAGTVGASGNNGQGVTGVNWQVKVLAIKTQDSSGSGATSAAINGIEAAIQLKQRLGAGADVRVLNASWGTFTYSQALRDQIDRAAQFNIFVVAAAGNKAWDLSATPVYPAAYSLPNLISVASIDNDDRMSSFSNFSRTLVHVGAPGSNVLSTVPTGYTYDSGTSMAAPHVSGATALIMSVCSITPAALKQTFISSAERTPELTGRVVSDGRIHTARALRICDAAARTRADFDGDGKSDLAIYHPSLNGQWSIRSSSGTGNYSIQWGGHPGDIPLAGDFDGDGRTDHVVYHPSLGGLWSIRPSSGTGNYSIQWGGHPGDIPMVGDFDGDGKSDHAVYHPSLGGMWSIRPSSGTGNYSIQWGGHAGDIPMVGDFDGDGKSDHAVYHPSLGGMWSIRPSSGTGNYSIQWGGHAGDIPLVGDFDGDGKSDLAVYHPSLNGNWSIRPSGGTGNYSVQWGGRQGDIPISATKTLLQ